jgi:hypothetical protein
VVTPDDINRFNQAQVVMSVRFLFSCSDNFSLASAYLKEHPEFADPNRPRLNIEGCFERIKII